MDKFAEMTVFLCVAEEGSFSAAGRKLSRSPSAVSKVIARIEERLQVRLFDRIAGTIRLTQEGQIFRAGAQRVADTLEEVENSIAADGPDVAGVLHVHTSLTFAKYQLVPLLPRFLKKYPKLGMKFIIGTDRGNFMDKRIDVAIHSGPPSELSLVGKPLFLRHWVIAAAPSYLREHGMPVLPADLPAHRCLNFTVRTHWNAWKFLEGDLMRTIDISGYVGADQGELLHAMALEGLGIVRLAEFHIGADIAAGKLVRLLADYQPAATDMMYALYPPGRVPAPRVKVFLDFLEEHFAGHAYVHR